MKKTDLRGYLILAGILCGLEVAPAAAKVVFTGYADMRAAPQGDSKISGSPALLASLGVTDRRAESRTFAIDSLGLFATTTFNEQADFLMDVTYKKIGAAAGETRLQYAYLHLHTPSLWELNAGRVMLPIGLYNRNYFYPFQRYSVTPPLFQSAIIGLPIADHGVILSKTIDAGPVGFFGSVYAVNGYGPSRASSETFRAGLGATDALLISNNLRDVNSNPQFAYGGNARVLFFPDRNVKAGVSSYQGAWNASGKDDFAMLNAYLSVDAGPASLLAEGLRTDTDNDKGVAGSFGVRDWKSSGAFLEASFRLIRKEERELALFAGTEETVAQGKGSGAAGRERLVQHKTGLSWRANPSVIFKSQLSQLDYRLPFQFGGGNESIDLRQRQILFSLTLTY